MKHFKGFLLLSGLGLLFGSTIGLGESRKSAGGVEERARNHADLTERWKELAGDATTWKRADINDSRQQFLFDLVAYRVQANNGEVTREQFLGITTRHAPDNPRPKEQRGSEDLDAQAEAAFRKMDANSDGLLDFDEMEESLQAERQKWDTDGNGFIDLNEFKEYFKARSQQEHTAALTESLNKAGARIGHGGKREPVPAVSAAPVDLPPGLPPWFREYDTDGDGQIGLYEWKAARQPIARFLEMDLNGDGFLTPDEVLHAHTPR